jgi:hypothetical protein
MLTRRHVETVEVRIRTADGTESGGKTLLPSRVGFCLPELGPGSHGSPTRDPLATLRRERGRKIRFEKPRSDRIRADASRAEG